MTDLRNIAHEEKVASDKVARGEDVAPGADEISQLCRNPHMEHHAGDDTEMSEAESAADA